MKKLSVKLQQAIIVGVTTLLGTVAIITASSNDASRSAPATQTVTSKANTVKSFDPAPEIDLSAVWRLVNDEREKVGLQPLARDPLLDRSAQEKCDDMVAKDYWSHDAPDGTEPWAFIGRYNVYTTAGENLAYGQRDGRSVVADWMASIEHRDNVLNSAYTNVGYARCEYPVTSKQGNNTIVVQHLADAP